MIDCERLINVIVYVATMYIGLTFALKSNELGHSHASRLENNYVNIKFTKYLGKILKIIYIVIGVVVVFNSLKAITKINLSKIIYSEDVYRIILNSKIPDPLNVGSVIFMIFLEIFGIICILRSKRLAVNLMVNHEKVKWMPSGPIITEIYQLLFIIFGVCATIFVTAVIYAHYFLYGSKKYF